MTREDVIRMAREFGWAQKDIDSLLYIVETVAAAEREACAKAAETLGVHPALNVYNGGPDWYKHGKDIAAAIRARGQA